MNPDIWGPHAWIFLHSITLGYPECPSDSDKRSFKNFFYSLQGILPCKKCRNNYVQHIKKNPLTDHILCSKERVVRWLVEIHNEVNKINGKPTKTYEQFLKDYYKIYNGSSISILNIILICCSLFIIVFTLVLVLVKYRKSK